MQIKAVLADLGGVLVQCDWQAIAAYWEAELALAPGEFLRCIFGGSDDTVLIGRVPEDSWWSEVGRRLSCDPALPARILAFIEEREVLDEELITFLHTLRPRVKTALVSNAWPSAARRARAEWALDRVCDTLVFSCEVGCRKPSSTIYEIACRRLEIPPAEALFVDDSPINVQAAKELGMAGVLFRDGATAIREISRLLEDAAPPESGIK